MRSGELLRFLPVSGSRVETSPGLGCGFAAARPRANRNNQAPRTGMTKSQNIQSICFTSASIEVTQLFFENRLFPLSPAPSQARAHSDLDGRRYSVKQISAICRLSLF